MAQPYRIITVCTGNICRSPMAEYLLREALGPDVDVDSAGISAWEDGNPIDPRAAATLSEHGITDTATHRARKFHSEDFSNDLILALDSGHLDWLKEQAPDTASQDKIRLLREFDPHASGNLDIADPWYGDIADFESSYQLIQAAIPGILAHVKAARVQTQHRTPLDDEQR